MNLFKKSPEDSNRFYICLPRRRLIFERCKKHAHYVGWYKPWLEAEYGQVCCGFGRYSV